jgi:hypothetical protein
MQTVKRNTKRIRDLSEIKAVEAFVRTGYHVSIPFGENNRYDLIVEKDSTLSRVQVKTGRLRKGVIRFACFSSHAHRGGPSCRRYTGEIDSFAVYCPDVDAVYLLPIDAIPVHLGMLRVVPTLNGQSRKIRWARDFELYAGRVPGGARSTVPEQLEIAVVA